MMDILAAMSVVSPIVPSRTKRGETPCFGGVQFGESVMIKTFKNKHAILLATVLALTAVGATAGTTGTEFQGLHTMLTGWANGYLGKALAIAAFLFGAGYGVAKQTIVPAILGIVFALVFAIGPGVIDGMLTATI